MDENEYIPFGELNPEAAYYWYENIQEFAESYMGNEMQYYHATIGEWVCAADASFYPREITKARMVQE